MQHEYKMCDREFKIFLNYFALMQLYSTETIFLLVLQLVRQIKVVLTTKYAESSTKKKALRK
jgi:hypothetical protein